MAAAAFIVQGALPAVVRAQDDEPGARVDPVTGALELELTPLLDDGGLRRALHSGLPIRVEVSVELWRDGFFDQQVDGGTWRASIIHDAVTESYEFQVVGEEPLSLPSMARVAEALQAGFRSTVRPQGEGRYYYLAEVEMQTLSLSDLEELRRWLQGDLGPAVQGERSPESAVGRGLRRVMVRALGLPARRERLRTSTFDWPPPVGASGSGGPARAAGERLPTPPPPLDVPPGPELAVLPPVGDGAVSFLDSAPPCPGAPEKPAG
ncbi:MAG TPA: hypothetical protein VK858_00285 [Longimicrobiales bacterium]|nr:hypothetical protein [Longimicrobiales bacterium]